MSDVQRKNVLADLIIPVLAFGFTVYYLSTITQVPWIAQASAVTVACLLFASILAFVIRTAHRVRRGREVLSLNVSSPITPVTVKRVVLFLLSIAYVGLIDTFGFTLTTLVFVFLSVMLLSSHRNWRAAAGTAFACSVLGYFVFIYLFQTRFPRGWIENTLKGLL